MLRGPVVVFYLLPCCSYFRLFIFLLGRLSLHACPLCSTFPTAAKHNKPVDDGVWTPSAKLIEIFCSIYMCTTITVLYLAEIAQLGERTTEVSARLLVRAVAGSIPARGTFLFFALLGLDSFCIFPSACMISVTLCTGRGKRQGNRNLRNATFGRTSAKQEGDGARQVFFPESLTYEPLA